MKHANLFFCSILAAVVFIALAACETTTTTNPTTGVSTTVHVTTAKTQDDVKWACFALTGGFTVYAAVAPTVWPNLSPTLKANLSTANGVVTNLCGHQDKLTNLNDAWQQIMDATGLVAAALATKPAS